MGTKDLIGTSASCVGRINYTTRPHDGMQLNVPSLANIELFEQKRKLASASHEHRFVWCVRWLPVARQNIPTLSISLCLCGSLNICQYPLPRATIYQNYSLFENLYNIAEIGLSLALNTNQSLNLVLVMNITEILLNRQTPINQLIQFLS